MEEVDIFKIEDDVDDNDDDDDDDGCGWFVKHMTCTSEFVLHFVRCVSGCHQTRLLLLS